MLHRVTVGVASRCAVSHRVFSGFEAITENNRSKATTLLCSVWTFKQGGLCFYRDTRELYCMSMKCEKKILWNPE